MVKEKKRVHLIEVEFQKEYYDDRKMLNTDFIIRVKKLKEYCFI